MTVIYKKMTQTQMIVVGYLLLILLGSILLMLPVSWKYDIFCRCIIYLDIRILCDWAGCTGYISALVFFWTAYHFDPDPDRRYGIYDNWCLCGDSVKKKDRA
mgnify:CR=1 FL=1